MFYHETLRIYHKSFLLILLAIISLPSGSINMFCYTVRTTRPEKCDIFAQRYQSQPITTKFHNTAYIFLTFRNHVKIFLSQNNLHNVSNVVYRKNLSIRTNRSDKTVKTLIRLLLASSTHHTARKIQTVQF